MDSLLFHEPLLLVKLYVPEGLDVGRFVNDNLAVLDGIDRTLTTLTFKAF